MGEMANVIRTVTEMSRNNEMTKRKPKSDDIFMFVSKMIPKKTVNAFVVLVIDRTMTETEHCDFTASFGLFLETNGKIS